MIKDFLCDADIFLSRLSEVSVIPMWGYEGKAVISGKTNDNQIWFAIKSKTEGYDYEQFAFRDWTVVSSALGSLSKDDKFSIDISTVRDGELDYPVKMTFKAKDINLTHYLQKYSALEKSEQVLKQYKERKFLIGVDKMKPHQEVEILNLLEMNKVANILGKREFTLELKGADLYFCLGDVNSRSSDNARVLASYNCSTMPTGKWFFPITEFTSLLKCFKCDCKVYLTANAIYIEGQTEHTDCTIKITGKMSDA